MLNYTDEAIANIITKIGNAAPEVWEAAINQVQVQIINNYIAIGIGLILSVAGIFLAIYLYKENKKQEEEEIFNYFRDGTIIFLIFCCMLFFILGLALLLVGACSLPKYYINPEWQAIQNLKLLIN